MKKIAKSVAESASGIILDGTRQRSLQIGCVPTQNRTITPIGQTTKIIAKNGRQGMNNKELYRIIKEFGSDKYIAGYKAGKADAEKRNPIKAEVLKHLQAVYDKGFKDGQATKEASGFVADDWYHENFGASK